MKRATVSADRETITVHIPMTFRKRGGRKMVVMPDGAPWAPRPRIDNAMVKALARAFQWRKIAPEIAEAILDGRQPAEMQLDDLLKGFPLEWDRQREYLAISNRSVREV